MLHLYKYSRNSDLEPIADAGRVSGFQSPAADYTQDRLNILERMVSDPLNTYYFEADTDEMEQFGIKTGTLLVVDRSKRPSGGMIVIAWQNGDWLVRQLITHFKKKYLTTGKEEDPMMEIKEPDGIIIWGVVTWSCCPQMELKKYVRPR